MQPSDTNLSPARVNAIVFSILILFPLLGMTIDLIAPSLPAISEALSISSAFSKWLIAIFLFGSAFGNFFVRFLSDAIGRKKLHLSAWTLFVLASSLPLMFTEPAVVFLARFLQGMSMGAFSVLTRGILSDVLSTDRLPKVMTYVATMWGIGPIIGPVIGGYLQEHFNWQADFVFFMGYGILGLILVSTVFPETHNHRMPFSVIESKKNLVTILSHKKFWSLVFLNGFTYALLIVFNTLGPFLIQHALGHSPLYYGKLALWMGLCFLVGTLLCRYSLSVKSPDFLFPRALGVAVVAALMGLIFSYVYPVSIDLIVVLSAVLFICSGIIYPAVMGSILLMFRHLAGSSNAVGNLFTVIITGVVATAMGFIHADTAKPLAWVYFLLMGCCALFYILLLREPKG